MMLEQEGGGFLSSWWIPHHWWLRRWAPDCDDDAPPPPLLHITAIPGLTTLLDSTLQEAVEGELTATLTSSHKLLLAWLDVKRRALCLIHALRDFAADHAVSVSALAPAPAPAPAPAAGRSSSSSRSRSRSSNSNKSHGQEPPGGAGGYHHNVVHVSNRQIMHLEHFARACLEAAHDMMDRMSVEKLSMTANLNDPYESLNNNGGSSGSGGSSSSNSSLYYYSTNTHPHPHHNALTSVTVTTLPSALEESKGDTGRRFAPQTVQRGHVDCWETSRLHCVDYVWADDVAQQCQKLLRNLWRTAVSIDFDWTTLQQHKHHHHHDWSQIPWHNRILVELIQSDVTARLLQFRASIEADSCVLKRLFLVKCEYRAPLRGFYEAHASVLKAPQLDLVNEYIHRAQTQQGQAQAQEHNNPKSTSSDATATTAQVAPSNTQNQNTNHNHHSTTTTTTTNNNIAQDHLSSLLENKGVLEALALEKKASELELDMAQALLPFTDLARFLDHKRARIRLVPGILDTRDALYDLNETLRRLKFLLCCGGGCRSSSSSTTTTTTAASAAAAAATGPNESSLGIRPLLLDLQGVPRDDEEDEETMQQWITHYNHSFLHHHHSQSTTTTFQNVPLFLWNAVDDDDENEEEALARRIDHFVDELDTLRRLVQHGKHSFQSDKPLPTVRGSSSSSSSSNSSSSGGGGGYGGVYQGGSATTVDLDLPASLARGCKEWDAELFSAQVQDWFQCVARQHQIVHEDPVWANFAERLRHAEIALSLSVAPVSSLEVVRERVTAMRNDRERRFDIVQECIEECCLREMNLSVSLRAPDPNQALILHPTTTSSSARGVFGLPLQRAGVILPLG